MTYFQGPGESTQVEKRREGKSYNGKPCCLSTYSSRFTFEPHRSRLATRNGKPYVQHDQAS